MALRFIDSFDYYDASHMTQKWTTAPSAALSASGGRRGTSGAILTNATAYAKVLDNQSTWTIGLSFKYAGGTPAGSIRLIRLEDAGTAQVDLRITTALQFQVTRNGTVLGTSSATCATGEQYVEFKAVINNTTGSYEVRVNGVNVLSGTGANTRNTANNQADRFVIGGDNLSGVGNIVDDLYVLDGTGPSPHNTFLGDCRVDAYLPNGDGSNSDFTCSTGSTHSALVDENPPNDDTDYVQSSTVNHKDSYAFADMSHTPATIYGVQANLTAKKDDAGARSIAAICKSSSTTSDGATQALATSYGQYREIWTTDPNTSAAWTKTNLNAAEFGIKVVA